MWKYLIRTNENNKDKIESSFPELNQKDKKQNINIKSKKQNEGSFQSPEVQYAHRVLDLNLIKLNQMQKPTENCITFKTEETLKTETNLFEEKSDISMSLPKINYNMKYRNDLSNEMKIREELYKEQLQNNKKFVKKQNKNNQEKYCKQYTNLNDKINSLILRENSYVNNSLIDGTRTISDVRSYQTENNKQREYITFKQLEKENRSKEISLHQQTTTAIELKKKKVFYFNVDPDQVDLKEWLIYYGLEESKSPYYQDFSQKRAKFYKAYNKIRSHQIVSQLLGNPLVTKIGLNNRLNSYKSKNPLFKIESFFPNCYCFHEPYDIQKQFQSQLINLAILLVQKFNFILTDQSKFKVEDYNYESNNQVQKDSKVQLDIINQQNRSKSYILNKQQQNELLSVFKLSVDLIEQGLIKKQVIDNAISKFQRFVDFGIEKSLETPIQEYIDKFRKYFFSSKKNGNQTRDDSINLESLKICSKKIIKFLKTDPQCTLNIGHNIWILKPGSRSRGLGIEIATQLNDIIKFMKQSGENQVVQKQIEKPLLYRQRKFDIRVWVLLIGVEPLTAQMQDDQQFRLSSKDQEMELEKTRQDRVVHLTNNYVQKFADGFDDNEIEGCMIEKDTFFAEMQSWDEKVEVDGQATNSLQEKIDSQIKNIIGISIRSGQDALEGRNNSFETLGQDFMIDSEMNVWLIEINRSPDLSHSTRITKKLVNDQFKDMTGLFNDAGWQNIHKINVQQKGCLKRLNL